MASTIKRVMVDVRHGVGRTVQRTVKRVPVVQVHRKRVPRRRTQD